METHRSSQDFKVNVKVNATPQADLAKVLAGIREDYETIIEKNRQDLDAWFQKQVTEQDVKTLSESRLPPYNKVETLLGNNPDA